ncbi:hypothetical protein BKA82DRAFT_10463 [Pisolithus tinctorius]|uniref:Uncharacterized protein n=1 Tax=Pisolithus tinctorius Marx 270 TaxID=870435 RepID=A0A0C3NU92_PISTI|nr:hypothetical protein BKA82DRAFT_10463 [Pisolithus tinctorius]KIN99010.1 hypothetical protein M404DRAFT_10463 [Pisolithus tinctorius Marx 270]
MAFFIPVADDKITVEAVLKMYGTLYNSQLLSKPKWILSHVQHHIPSPEILLPCIADVITTYGPLKDAVSGQPLFNAWAWEIVKNMLENVHLGYYSDPPGVELHFEIRKDQDGLKLYWCCHGTNSMEGGVHQYLIQHFKSFNTCLQHAINVLLDYAVGTLNRTGMPYFGHFDIPLKNHITHLLELTSNALCHGTAPQSGWMNGDNYAPANETFGMIKLTPDFTKPLGMWEFSPKYAQEQNIHHCLTTTMLHLYSGGSVERYQSVGQMVVKCDQRLP